MQVRDEHRVKGVEVDRLSGPPPPDRPDPGTKDGVRQDAPTAGLDQDRRVADP